jgi:hypothetical protein
VKSGVLLLLLFVLMARVSLAQSEPLTSAYRDAVIYAGPGSTYLQTGILRPGIEVSIVERNRIGNWLRVRQQQDGGAVALDGWVLSGYLNLPADLQYSELPVSALPDASSDYNGTPSLVRLHSAPLISEVSQTMREIYERGQALGNHSRVVTKVGDSLTADPLYLTPIRQTDYVLGPYDYLEETINYFGPSTAENSLAARIGMTSLVLFDPMWANADLCEPTEIPLACEYRIRQPSISFIMFGPNDVMRMTDAIFARQMRQIVDETLARGIIPVLSTFSYHPDAELWWQSVNFNLALIDLASEYQIPLINLWAAARVLPEYGLDQDRIHMLHSGFRYLKYDSGHEAWYGVSLRNLLSIRMLDEIRRTLEME